MRKSIGFRRFISLFICILLCFSLLPVAALAATDLTVKSSSGASDSYALTQITGSSYDAQNIPVYQVSVPVGTIALAIKPAADQLLCYNATSPGGRIHESLVPDWIKEAWWLTQGEPTLDAFLLDYGGYESLDALLTDWQYSYEQFLNDFIGIQTLNQLPQLFGYSVVPDADYYDIELSSTQPSFLAQSWPSAMDGAKAAYYDSTANYAFVYIKHLNNPLDSMTYEMPTLDTVLVIKIGGVFTPAGADKTELQAAISTDVSGYYQANDRYNGKTYTGAGGSFWSAYQSALSAANTVNNTQLATQEEVDAATANLTAAIANLIPTTQVNATDLYELAHTSYKWSDATAVPATSDNSSLDNVTAANTTAATWAAHQAALSAGSALLTSLYDTDGTPTAINDSSNSTTTAALAGAVTGLQTAVAGLDRLAGDTVLGNAQMAWSGLDGLAGKLFNPAALDSSKYDPGSLSAFTDGAWTNARAFLDSHGAPTASTGTKEAAAYVDAYKTLWTACYENLAAAPGSLSVTLSISDNHALLNGLNPSSAAGTYQLTLPAGATLDGALREALGSGYNLLGSLPPVDLGLGVYINGIYVFNMASGNSANGSPASRGWQNILLHDGDTVVVALMKLPTEINMSGSLLVKSGAKVIADIQYLRVSKAPIGSAAGTVGATSGQALGLYADAMFALPSGYNGGRLPLSGASVWISPCFATEAEARAAAASGSTGAVTGSDGSFSLKLYPAPDSAEGWYALSLVAAGDNGGLANGANVIVHVTDPSDISGIIGDLKAQLAALKSAYPDTFYTDAQLAQINSLFDAGNAGIGGAATGGAAYAAYLTAYDGIAAIQKANAAANDRNIGNARWLMAWLPSLADTNAGKLYMGDKLFLDALFGDGGVYSQMTPYQLSQLTVSESGLLEALRGAYAASDNGANLESTSSFKINFTFKDADSGETLEAEDIGARFDGYYYGASELRFDNNGVYTGVYSGPQINVTDLGAVNQAGGIPAGVWLHLVCWMGYNPTYTFVSAENNIDGHYISFKDSEHFNRTATGVGISMTMARQDTQITVTVREITTAPPDELAEAQRDAAAAINNAYAAYQSHEYSDANWLALTEYKNNGLEAVAAATTVAAVETARDAAFSAMAAVEKKPPSGLTIPGFGDVMGTVDLYIENTTFPGGAFTGTIVSEPGFSFASEDTMMTIILRALAENGFSWSGIGGGYNITYLSSIYRDTNGNGSYEKGEPKLGEFDGESGSGWMGTLNDWFTNLGFQDFSEANGKIADGDEIRVMYTQNLGADLGGSWYNSDTSLSGLTLSAGALYPSFDPAVNTYTVLLDSTTKSLKVTPAAANKNYLVKAFLNKKVTDNSEDNSFYKRTRSIPVRGGDVIHIGVGEYAWPSMNNQGAEARIYTGTWYDLNIFTNDDGINDADWVIYLINALPAAKDVKLTDNDNIRNARNTFNELPAAEQAKVISANEQKLRDCEARLLFLQQIETAKTLLAALPRAAQVTLADKAAVMAADTAYKALSEEQKLNLIVGDVNNYIAALAKLAGLESSSYTVNLTTSDTDKNPGDTVTVDLSVDGSAGSYAALQTVIGYDSSRLSYTGSTFGEEFTVADKPDSGKLLIIRVGDTTSTGDQGSLSFTVKNDIPAGSGTAVFTVISAIVGVSGDPSDPPAAATGADAGVNVHNLTVTFTAGPHVTMDSATAYARYGIAGLYTDNSYTTVFTEPVPTADSGYVLASPVWNDGSGQVAYDTIAATAFTAGAVYTATVTQDISVNITLPEQVTVISGITDGKANYGTDVLFRVTPGPGQEIVSVTYTVGNGSPVTLTESEGVYTIPGTELTADVFVTVTEKPSGTVSFISFDDYKGAPTGFKVLKFDGSAPGGYKYQYNGADMYHSEKYQRYVCFAAADVTAETALAAITCVAGTAPAVNYDGNVNQSGAGLNIIDAQLVYDLYTGVYLTDPAFAAISQLMRFAADINGDGCTDTSDVQIIVSLVQSQEM